MSLQLSYEASTGVTHTSAYHKIIGLQHRRGSNTMVIMVDIFKDAAAKTAGKTPVGSAGFMVDADTHDTYYGNSVLDTVGQNHVERSYVYLKTLSDYSGATDV